VILRAWRDGWRRVLEAPALIGGVYAITLVLAVPLALTMRSLLASHLGASLAANDVANGVGYAWWQEFAAQASGLGTTFGPTIIGFAATLDSLSNVADGRRPVAAVAGAVGLYLVVWAFLLGGLIDRLARQRPTRAVGFFGACGRHLGVVLRIGIVAGLVYGWLFLYLHPWLDDRFRDLIQNMSVERSAFLVRLALYLLVGALVVAANIVFDYAKVRAVVEDRRSALGALVAACRFVTRRRGHVLALYAANAATFLALMVGWAAVAPGATGPGASMWAAFALGQLVVAARLLLKLQFLASQTSLFQSHLAHAEYTAAPAAVWPESPAAEAIIGR
jgi:hypothetical protein